PARAREDRLHDVRELDAQRGDVRRRRAARVPAAESVVLGQPLAHQRRLAVAGWCDEVQDPGVRVVEQARQAGALDDPLAPADVLILELRVHPLTGLPQCPGPTLTPFISDSYLRPRPPLAAGVAVMPRSPAVGARGFATGGRPLGGPGMRSGSAASSRTPPSA